jgi:DNA-binding response OmpR family regulator
MEQPSKRYPLASTDDGDSLWEVQFAEASAEHVTLLPPRSYRQAFGGEPIQVGIVEFQIMLFLSRRPYHAFTRRQICEAISADYKVAEDAVDSYVASLRNQLGVFHDFVQAVPYVGYRYKA